MEIGPELDIQRGISWKNERDTRNKPEAGLDGTKMKQTYKCTPGKPDSKKEKHLIQTSRPKGGLKKLTIQERKSLAKFWFVLMEDTRKSQKLDLQGADDLIRFKQSWIKDSYIISCELLLYCMQLTNHFNSKILSKSEY